MPVFFKNLLKGMEYNYYESKNSFIYSIIIIISVISGSVSPHFEQGFLARLFSFCSTEGQIQGLALACTLHLQRARHSAS
jgi:hypothetical protein